MQRSKLYEYIKWFLIVFIIFIAMCFMLQFYKVKVFDRKPVSISSELASNGVSVELPEPTNSWETAIRQSEVSGDVGTYTGTIYSIDVNNNQDHAIRDWELKIEINQNCYLNGFWCGCLEIHQFRNGEEIVETVDPASFDLSSMQLEHNIYTDDLMINLCPGDYLIYLPSESVGETYIEGGGSVGIGMILYSKEPIDLSKNTITYYNQRSITEGSFFKVIMILLAVWSFMAIVYCVSYSTYSRTKRAVESLSQSVINGLSREYKSLWLIDTEKRTVKLVRSLDDGEVKNAVNIAQGFTDYDVSMKYYIEHYIDEKDKDRVWNNINFESLLQHVNEEEFYSVYYLHHPYKEVSVYFEMAFTKSHDINNSENIILAYRDVDSHVREEQLKKQQLEDALIEAERANNAKSEFLANMSHEIRTPINAILGMDTMILRETKEEGVREYAKDIKNASNTLLGLINDILDFSKIESGKMELVPAKYMLDSVINDLMNMIRPKAEEKDLDVELVLNPETPVKLFGDEMRVKQIILNILNNAVKYTKQGKVTLTVDFEITEPDVCQLFISVKDTGMGIKPEDMDKLFSPYERLDRNKNRTVEGTGLGLSIVKNLLEKMGSRLEVESVYGQGSDFKFKLSQPMWGPEPIGDHLSETTVIDEEAEEKFHAPEAKLLIVDDVEMNLMVIKGLLKRTEIEPVTCLSGKEGLEQAKASKYDLIFLDAMMPEMSGEETLQHIRAEADINKETPIVVLTANAIVGAKEEYMAVGFTDYLSKPVNGQQLEDMIQKYIPQERLVLPGPEGFAAGSQAKAEKSQSDIYIEALQKLENINTEEGIKASGSRDTYINVCNNFYETAPSRIKMITDYYDAKDADNYAIQTHALKSSARLIGALELSEMALEMELAGKSSNWDLINEKTEKLITVYKSIYNELKSIFESGQSAGDSGETKKDITPKKLRRILGDLQELIMAYDFESAKEIVGTLKEYNLPENFADVYSSIKASMAEVDYDGITKEIESYLAEGGK